MRIAITALVTLTCAVGVHAQESAHVSPTAMPRADTLYRQPITAALLGTVVPGAGHIYAGEYVNGVRFYAGTVSTIALGSLVYIIDDCTFSFFDTKPCDPGPQWPHRALGLAVIGTGVGMWVYSAVDAPRAARRANERHRRHQVSLAPIFRESVGSGRGLDVGIALAW